MKPGIFCEHHQFSRPLRSRSGRLGTLLAGALLAASCSVSTPRNGFTVSEADRSQAGAVS